MKQYDLIVIGGGPAGYLAGERAGHAGLKTLVIEKRALGGVCLNEGCIPSKSFLHCAKVFDYTKHAGDYGISLENAKLDHAAVVKRKNKVVNTLVSGIGAALKGLKVDVVQGVAAIERKTADGYVVSAGQEQFVADKLLIASGSVPVLPPIDGLADSVKSGYALTNREILDIETVPPELVIVGGGVIGLEMASYFNSAGSKVTVIEMLPYIGGNCDREIAETLKAEYEKKGVKFLLNSRVTRIADGKVTYDGGEVSADKVLLSIGRRAFTEGLGLENIGVLTERGKIITDRYMRTNLPGVYAAGDVNGKLMLAHTAYRETEVAINNILGKRDVMRYDAIASVIYTNPEVGSVGLTEEQCREQKIEYKVGKASAMYSGRYVAENLKGSGFCKVLCDKKTGKLLGVHILSSYASEMIVGAALMLEMEMTVEDIKELVFPHPTVCEIIREAIFAI